MIETFQAKPQLEKNKQHFLLQNWQIVLLEAAVILAFVLLPLFLNYPYRINIFLSWEGAYRLSLGHIPYKDFGLPLGFAYWLLPALFFKLFGPYLFTLVKAQVLLNLIAAVAFRSVLTSFNMESGKRLLLVVFFCLTYLFFNFWPWYNQTVFIFELVALAFLLYSFKNDRHWHQLGLLFLAGLFTTLSLFTKQDGGGLALFLCISLALYQSVSSRNIIFLGGYLLSFFLITAAFVAPFIPYDFLYWFNFGQEPHYSRISLGDIMDEFLGSSQWLKFYMILVSLLYLNKLTGLKDILSNKKETLFYLLVMGILVQATIIQITSYIPPDNNIYFHSFALAYVLHAVPFRFSFSRITPLVASIVLIFFWWSGTYYKYVQRVLKRIMPAEAPAATAATVVSKDTYVFSADTSRIGVNVASWIELPNSPAFDRVYMPRETVAGIERLRQMPLFAAANSPKVLNMTELTPLAHELGFELEKGMPLWYHLNVSMFDKELEVFKNRVENDYYDVVLFEYIPNLNNFYPFELRELLQQEYRMQDKFLAPRPQNNAFIEVYVPKEKGSL